MQKICYYNLPVFVYQLLEAQADYHRRSLAALEEAIPAIRTQQGDQQDIKLTFSKSANNLETQPFIALF